MRSPLRILFGVVSLADDREFGDVEARLAQTMNDFFGLRVRLENVDGRTS